MHGLRETRRALLHVLRALRQPPPRRVRAVRPGEAILAGFYALAVLDLGYTLAIDPKQAPVVIVAAAALWALLAATPTTDA